MEQSFVILGSGPKDGQFFQFGERFGGGARCWNRGGSDGHGSDGGDVSDDVSDDSYVSVESST